MACRVSKQCAGALSWAVTWKSTFLGTQTFVPLHLPNKVPRAPQANSKGRSHQFRIVFKAYVVVLELFVPEFPYHLVKETKRVSTPSLLLFCLTPEAEAFGCVYDRDRQTCALYGPRLCHWRRDSSHGYVTASVWLCSNKTFIYRDGWSATGHHLPT